MRDTPGPPTPGYRRRLERGRPVRIGTMMAPAGRLRACIVHPSATEACVDDDLSRLYPVRGGLSRGRPVCSEGHPIRVVSRGLTGKYRLIVALGIGRPPLSPVCDDTLAQQVGTPGYRLRVAGSAGTATTGGTAVVGGPAGSARHHGDHMNPARPAS